MTRLPYPLRLPQPDLAALALALSISLALLLPATPAYAQTPGSVSTAVPLALPAQPLAQMLAALSRQFGTAIGGDASLLEGRSAPALQGNLTLQQALEQVLAGSDLSVRDSGSGALTIVRKGGSPDTRESRTDATTLARVRIIGSVLQERSTEETASYTTGSTSAATGLNLSLRETPQAVSIITRQRIEDQGLRSVGEVLDQVTGMSSYGMGGGRYTSYSWFHMRGFQVNNMLLDGALVPAQLFNTDWRGIGTDMIDSVTVVHGANGLLAGSGDPSGTVALTRKRPTQRFQGSTSISVGRWDQRHANLDVGGPLIDSGRLRGRLVTAVGSGESWLERYRDDETMVYGILEADVGSASRAWLALDHGRTHGRGGAAYQASTMYEDGSPTSYRRGFNAFSNWSFSRQRNTNVTLGFEHRFNSDWSGRVQYITGESHNYRKFSNVTGSPFLDGSVGVYSRRQGDKTAAQSLLATVDGHYRLWGREHQVTVGFNGYASRGKDNEGNVADSSVTWPDIQNWQGIIDEPDWGRLSDPWERHRRRSSQYGIFVNNQLKVLESLSLLTGARLSNWRNRETSMDTGEVSDDRSENAVFTPFIGLVHDLNRNLSAYASYTTIFQPNSARDQAGTLLDPETGRSFEVGLKGAWYDNRLNASLALFQARKDNLAVPDGGLTPSGEDSFVATDHTRARGWELEIGGEPLPGWSLQAGYGQAIIRDSSGIRLLTDAPRHTFRLFTSWTPGTMPQLTVGGGLYWRSKTYASYLEPASLPAGTIRSYTVGNLMARYHINGNLSLALNVINLFDRVYRVDETGHDYGSPRTAMVTAKYQF